MTKESQEFTQTLSHIQEEAVLAEKLKLALEFMNTSLKAQPKALMKNFWMMKKECLALFKNAMHPQERMVFWDEYTRLLEEAHQIQHFLDGEVSFEVEQTKLAIDALEKQYHDFNPSRLVEDGQLPQDLPRDWKKLQLQIQFFRSLSDRIYELKKEIFGMEIRLSQKNKLVQQLQSLQNKIVPTKNQWIASLSEEFFKWVQKLATTNFDMQQKILLPGKNPQHVKNEIKRLQSYMKSLSLTSKTFKESRSILTAAWNILAAKTEEFYHQKKEEEKLYKEYLAPFLEKIEALAVDQHLKDRLMDIENEAKKAHLPQAAQPLLKKAISHKMDSYYNFVSDQEKRIREERKRKQEQEKQKKEEFLSEIQKLQSIDEKMKARLEEKAKQMPLSAHEKIFVDQTLMHLLYQEASKNVHSINMDEIEAHLERIAVFRDMSRERMFDCKNEIRKCGLDLEKALIFKELLEQEQELLESLEEHIELIAEKA